MTLADLAVAIKERALAVAREHVTLAWRTAYYHRVKTMPDLRDELDNLRSDEGQMDGDALPEGRFERIRQNIRGYFIASNAHLAGKGA